jgi:hypothetical protein
MGSPLPDVTALLASLTSELDRRGIRFMLIGGQTVLLHGEARFTADSARIDALERIATVDRWSPETLDILTGDLPLLWKVARWMGHVSARLLGAPRLARCFAPSWST